MDFKVYGNHDKFLTIEFSRLSITTPTLFAFRPGARPSSAREERGHEQSRAVPARPESAQPSRAVPQAGGRAVPVKAVPMPGLTNVLNAIGMHRLL